MLVGSWLSCHCAGVANIMAYSWFSHCEKYLKSLEYEKRFMKKQKVRDPSPSLSSKLRAA